MGATNGRARPRCPRVTRRKRTALPVPSGREKDARGRARNGKVDGRWRAGLEEDSPMVESGAGGTQRGPRRGAEGPEVKEALSR